MTNCMIEQFFDCLFIHLQVMRKAFATYLLGFNFLSSAIILCPKKARVTDLMNRTENTLKCSIL